MLLKLIRRVILGRPDIRECKIALFDGIGPLDSVREFGGIWGVQGLYLTEAIRKCGCRRAWMIDSLRSPEWEKKARKLEASSDCRIETTYADFREPGNVLDIEPADLSILYDILLHQDNSVEVIKNVCRKTRKWICVAQPTLKDALFDLPNACVNLQFYPKKLKDRLRKGYRGWPDEPMVEVFEAGFWIWGQTPSYLHSVFRGYRWSPAHVEIVPQSRYLDYVLIRYRPSS